MQKNAIQMRRVIITDSADNCKYEMPFDSNKVADSEALHLLLCFVFPDDEYTVQFTNKEFAVESTVFNF